MVLNIGKNEYVLTKDIVAIIDRKSMDNNKNFNEFLNTLGNTIDLKRLKDSKIKSYLILNNKNGSSIRVSEISSGTLYKRNKMEKWR